MCTESGILFTYRPHFAGFFIFKRIDETQFGLVEVVLRSVPIGATFFYDIADRGGIFGSVYLRTGSTEYEVFLNSTGKPPL